MTRSRARAQSTIEFAIGATVFFMLILGIVDFGRAIWSYNSIAYLAREGARYAVVPGRSSTVIANYVSNQCSIVSDACYTPPLPTALPANAAGISVSSTGACTDRVNGQYTTVTVTYAFQPVSLMIANLWGGGLLDLSASSQMLVEPC